MAKKKDGRNCLRVLCHGAKMVRRNLRSYVMLSVTIVMSFSLLLGYLVYTDSQQHNDYKETLAMDSNVTYLSDGLSEDGQLSPAMQLALQKVGQIPGAHSYLDLETTVNVVGSKLTLDGNEVMYPQICLHSLPRKTFGLYARERLEILWLPGQERTGLVLKPGEALIDEQWYYALGLDKTNEYSFLFRQGYDWDVSYLKVKIVGVVRDNSAINYREVFAVKQDSSGSLYVDANLNLYVSVDTFTPVGTGLDSWCTAVIYHTDPYEVAAALSGIAENSTNTEVFLYSNVRSQDQAYREIRSQSRMKLLIAGALLLLLGINLYSSFTNAMNDRKFEIGVKRALGASAWSIVRQFLYESLLVMAANIFLSVCVVADVSIVYKMIRERTPDEFGVLHGYTIWVSPFSIAMFFVCAISLSVVFSLIFAYRSTRVQIVDYLKAE